MRFEDVVRIVFIILHSLNQGRSTRPPEERIKTLATDLDMFATPANDPLKRTGSDQSIDKSASGEGSLRTLRLDRIFCLCARIVTDVTREELPICLP